MYELPWFKTETNIFSNRKIQLILKLTDGDTYFRVWIQLIALAVECNNKGRLEIGDNNPMTIENFSKIMGKSKKKIEKILNKFLELVKNWDKYQSIENYEKYQMQNRERQKRYREKLKSENEKSNVIQTLSNGQEKNTKELRTRKEENIREESENGFREYKI